MPETLDSGPETPDSGPETPNWRVPKYPPGEKSICCQKFGDVVGPGGWDGTLRWGPEAPKCLVHRSKGGSRGVKMTKNGKMVIFFKKIKKS